MWHTIKSAYQRRVTSDIVQNNLRQSDSERLYSLDSDGNDTGLVHRITGQTQTLGRICLQCPRIERTSESHEKVS
jgi:hypothetical protein